MVSVGPCVCLSRLFYNVNATCIGALLIISSTTSMRSDLLSVVLDHLSRFENASRWNFKCPHATLAVFK